MVTTATEDDKKEKVEDTGIFGINFNDATVLAVGAVAIGTLGALGGQLIKSFLYPNAAATQQQQPQPPINTQQQPPSLQPNQQPLTAEQYQQMYRQQYLDKRQKEEQDYIESLKAANQIDRNYNKPIVRKKKRYSDEVNIIDNSPTFQQFLATTTSQQPPPIPHNNSSSMIVSDDDINNYSNEFNNLKIIPREDEEQQQEEGEGNDDIDLENMELDENDLKALE